MVLEEKAQAMLRWPIKSSRNGSVNRGCAGLDSTFWRSG
jgi:hypothetical protein